MSTLNQAFSTGGGLATEATLLDVLADTTAILADTASLDAKTPAQGQAAMAASVPVTIASDQTAVPVSGPLTNAELRASAVPVSAASLPLPTGAATLAEQQTQTTHLSQIEAAVELIDNAIQTQSAAATNEFMQIGGVASGNAHRWQVNASGHGQVSVADALPAGTNNIGDVDVLTLPISYDVGNSDASTQRVVIASDQPAVPIAQSTPAASTVKQAAIVVGTSAVRLTTDGSAPSAGRRKLVFRPDADSTDKFFWGGSSVAASGASRGVPVFPGESVELDFDAGDYYIIAENGGDSVFIVEQE